MFEFRQRAQQGQNYRIKLCIKGNPSESTNKALFKNKQLHIIVYDHSHREKFYLFQNYWNFSFPYVKVKRTELMSIASILQLLYVVLLP